MIKAKAYHDQENWGTPHINIRCPLSLDRKGRNDRLNTTTPYDPIKPVPSIFCYLQYGHGHGSTTSHRPQGPGFGVRMLLPFTGHS